MWPSEESDKVENYRFLENCSIEFAENQQKKSVFNILSPSVMKNCKIVSENFRVFFRLYNVQIGKIFKNRFFQILIFALLYSHSEKYQKLPKELDFHENSSNSFRETDNFWLYQLLSRDQGKNCKIGPVQVVEKNYHSNFVLEWCKNQTYLHQ